MAPKSLNREFREFLKLLIDEGVRFLLIGGYAVAYYGYSRYTQDIDVFVEMSRDNSLRLSAAVGKFMMPQSPPDPLLFLRAGRIVRLGTPPMRVEIHNTISGVEFAGAYERAAEVMIDNLELKIISLADLKKNKLASGRGKDLIDYEHLPAD